MTLNTTFLAAALALAASAAHAGPWVSCDSAGRYLYLDRSMGNPPVKRGVAFAWAVRKNGVGGSHIPQSAGDPVWQYALCNVRTHEILWCLPSGERISRTCVRVENEIGRSAPSK